MVLGLATLSAPLLVQGQDLFDSIDQKFKRFELNPVVVTATRTPKELKDVPVATMVIGENDIKKTDASNAQELLQQAMPGFECTYSYSQQPVLDLQGFGGGHVLFLMDGERLAGETLDNVDFYRLSLLNVGQVEVVKGAASCLYGSSAMGGVVNFISREPHDPWSLHLNAKMGAHGEQRYGGVLGLKSGIFRSSTLLQYTTIDNINLLKPGQISAGDFSTIIGNTTWNLSERISLDISKRWSLTARGGLFARERNSSPMDKDRYYDANFGLKSDYEFANGDVFQASYAFDQYDKGGFSVSLDAFRRTYRNQQQMLRTCYSHSFDSLLLLTAGGDLMRDYLQSYQFTDSGSHGQTNAALFVQADWLILPHLNLVAGLRYDYYSAAQMQHLSPQINLLYKFPNLNLRMGYAHGYRAPSLKEMFMDFDMPVFWIYGNRDLKPETSHCLQSSAEYYYDWLSVMVLGFFSRVSDRISTAWFADLAGHRYLNLDAMSIMGADLSLTAHTDWGLSATAGYTYTHESIRKGLLINASSRPHTAMMRVDYSKRFDKWLFSIGLSGRILSAIDSEEYNAVGDLTQTSLRHYPGYSLFKLQASVHYRGTALTLAIDNLLDYVPDYYYIKSPITTGRTLSLTLAMDVDKMWK